MAASMLALLSHTEPRVLAWAELDEICEGEDGTALYLEVLGDPALYVASAYINVADCKKQITAGDARLEALMEINPEMFSASCYGSTWRLWDGKPSDEKRSACGWM